MVKTKVVSIVFVFLLGFIFFPEMKAHAQKQHSSDHNDYPIILVHGLAGWGENELGGYKYWGGYNDIKANLDLNGYETYTAAVGPFSSNYDRAVELYYRIKGGKVDYGAAHAKKHGHLQFGEYYPGFYKKWNATHKVHLVGHSMGGQTIRVLEELLRNGSPLEQGYHEKHPSEKISPLYQGGNDWVHSITTIATPHNGTTFANGVKKFLPFVKDTVIHLAATSGYTRKSFVYDFKLDQWGLSRKPGESFMHYTNRVLESDIWETKDISLYDLSTTGAQDINEWADIKSDVYYFSYSGNATYRSIVTGHYLPLVFMNPTMMGPSIYIGQYEQPNGSPPIDASWWPNDGLVSVVSAKHPFGQPAKLYSGNGEAETGVWNFYPTKYRWDHQDFIGLDLADTLGITNIYAFYQSLASELTELPKE
ncbi:esterase/lipase family protein [Virgibacillus siamensis]|uniref:esterase/lipase family protein n=1 Tax=Virgibacillus siamensis TaxID=480071 RepID=UPI0009843588|nr:lipase [Virgibacillus siamensis]